MENPVQVVHNYLNLMNELRSEIDVSKSICKPTSTESILQSSNEQSTNFPSRTNAKYNTTKYHLISKGDLFLPYFLCKMCLQTYFYVLQYNYIKERR